MGATHPLIKTPNLVPNTNILEGPTIDDILEEHHVRSHDVGFAQSADLLFELICGNHFEKLLQIICD